MGNHALTLFLLGVFLLGWSDGARSQQGTCQAAVYQLSQYASRVNHFAAVEYNQNIPARCRGYTPCMHDQANRLSHWYQVQAGLVNQWYAHIVDACSKAPPGQNPAPPITSGGMPRIDDQRITSIPIRDPNRTVDFEIPTDPQGYVR